MNTSGRNEFDLIHKTSSIIAMNSIQIQVLGNQYKKLKLGLFIEIRPEVSKPNPNYNFLGK